MSNELKKTEMTEIRTDSGIIKLNPKIIRQYLVRGNGNVSDQEVMLFLSLCKFQKLNPFLNEAYLVKFGNQPANIIIGKELFTKRAYREPRFKGMKAGIIVIRDGEVLELEGAFKLKNDELVGGWAEVHTSDKAFPFVTKVSLEEYDKKQSTWKQIPNTMIRKVALVQCLREAFPDLFQAMYSQEEMPVDQELINRFDKVETPAECKVEEVASEVETVDVEYTEVEKEVDPNLINLNQIKRLYAIGNSKGLTKDEVKKLMVEMFKKESTKELTLVEYDAIVNQIELMPDIEEEKGEVF